MIKVSGLYKSYGSHLAVKNAGFEINDGEVVGFLGPNGAGKSTIMNILTGYLSMTQGSVEVDGYSVLDDPTEVRRRIGYLPEQPPLYVDMTVKEYLSFVYDLKKVEVAASQRDMQAGQDREYRGKAYQESVQGLPSACRHRAGADRQPGRADT